MSYGNQRRALARRTPKFERLGERIALTADPIVVQQGDVLFVFGTPQDDHIEVDLGTDSHRVTIGGELHSFDAHALRHVVISGQGGDDEANIDGTAAEETVHIDADEVEMLSRHYHVRVRHTEVVRLFGNQGFDTARILDSAGDDAVYMHPTFTGYSNSDGEIRKVVGFEEVNAFAERGGFDRASFYDSVADDLFVAKEDFSYLTGTRFSNYARGFDRVDAYHRQGGADEARLWGSHRNDALHAQPHQMVLQVGSTKQVTHNFPQTRAYGQGGSDSAQFHGTAGLRDSFGWREGFAFLSSFNEQGLVAANSAEGFEVTKSFGQDDNDHAKLTGSHDEDVVVALPEITQLTTARGDVVVSNNFALVSTYGNGGDDFAHLEDGPGNDRFTTKDEFAFFRGPGFVNYINGFGKIDAVSRTGGGDFAHAQEYEGPDQDYVIHDRTQFLIYGPERSERFIDFEAARGDAVDAGWQVLRPILQPFTLGGSHDASETGVPSEDDIEAIQSRLAEPVGTYEVVDGRIRFVT